MPVLSSDYQPPWPFTNGHLSTIYAAMMRKVLLETGEEKRWELPDGDFIDTVWNTHHSVRSEKLLILLHGLEGHALRPYMKGAAKAFYDKGCDVCGLHFRGCSDTPNRLFRSYHSGDTGDLRFLLRKVMDFGQYKEIIAMGFSLGGNVLLKYLGEEAQSTVISRAIAVSVPVNLHDSMLALHERKNRIYARRFKSKLLGKLKTKQSQFPDLVTKEMIDSVRRLRDFDEVYTAPAHGFPNAMSYYSQSSSKSFLSSIHVPTLLINAKNDSFLAPSCYPTDIAENHKQLYLEMPDYGGHVGFYLPSDLWYHEKRALEFCGFRVSP